MNLTLGFAHVDIDNILSSVHFHFSCHRILECLNLQLPVKTVLELETLGVNHFMPIRKSTVKIHVVLTYSPGMSKFPQPLSISFLVPLRTRVSRKIPSRDEVGRWLWCTLKIAAPRCPVSGSGEPIQTYIGEFGKAGGELGIPIVFHRIPHHSPQYAIGIPSIATGTPSIRNG